MTSRTIDLSGLGIHKEAIAGAAITPGHLVEFGTAGVVQVHGGAGLNASPMFALEDELQGNGIDVAYAADDNVIIGVFPIGAEINAILEDGHVIVKGEFLESAGDGTLQALTTDTATDDAQRRAIVAQAMEAVTTSGATARIRVQAV